MKKITIALLIIFTGYSSSAQVHMEFGLGVSKLFNPLPSAQDNEGNKTEFKSVYPTFKLSLGYQFENNIVIEAVELPTLSRVKNSPKYFGLKAGYNINGLIPAAGYYYNYCNADNTENNGWHIGYSLKYQFQINDNGGLFAEGIYINNSVGVSAGIHCQF